ncbi:MAG: cupin domain-containing protein [Actinobacteria bacterium]|nr:cupin domain-containing protein [Actinomycetota bacterium]
MIFEEKKYKLVSPEKAVKRITSTGCLQKIYINGNKITCGTFIIPPNTRLGRISAHGSDETLYVLRGLCKIELPRLKEIIEVKKEELFYIPAGMIHAPFNDGVEEVEVFWSCAPDWP